MKQLLQRLLTQNSAWSNILFGLACALLVCLVYKAPPVRDFIDNNIQDQFYRYRLNAPRARPDIVLVGIDNKTTTRLGWPIARNNYTQVIKRLKQQGAKGIAFNLLISVPGNPTIDKPLVETVREAGNVIMPVFYNYAEQNMFAPMKELKGAVAALGNVAVYPGTINRYIDSQILNRETQPHEIYFPMGVELARLALDIPSKDVRLSQSGLGFGDYFNFPLEEGQLMRISYQGPPSFFQRVSFEDVLDGKSRFDFKDKIVLIGAMEPSLADVAQSPYGAAANLPMYGTEVQAHILQSILNRAPVRHIPLDAILVLTLLLGGAMMPLLQRLPPGSSFLAIALPLSGLFILAYLTFSLINLQIDIGPLVFLFPLLGLVNMIRIKSRSTQLLESEIAEMLKIDANLPQSKSSNEKHVFNALTTLLYISQAEWVAYRAYVPSTKTLQLQRALNQEGQDIRDSLPPAYPANFLEHLPPNVVPIQWKHLPVTFKEKYPESQGYFMFMPLGSQASAALGLLELYFCDQKAVDALSTELHEDIRKGTIEAMNRGKRRENQIGSGLSRDIEEQINGLSRLRQNIMDDINLNEKALKSSRDPLVVCDPLGEILSYSESFIKALNLELDRDLRCENIMRLMDSAFALNPKEWHEAWMTTIHKRNQKEFQVKKKTHLSTQVFLLSLTPVVAKDYLVHGLVMILKDITDLHRQANYDKLTGLCNRRYFDEELLKQFQLCKRNPDKPFSLMLLDLDHFKSFNDTYGHQIGDEVLTTFGQVIAEIVRKTDFPARYGGEEMAVILPSTRLEGAAIAAEKIRSAIELVKLHDVLGNPIRTITASIGVAEFDPGDITPEEILRRSDDALYKCKEAGRNCIHLHTLKDIEIYQATVPERDPVSEIIS